MTTLESLSTKGSEVDQPEAESHSDIVLENDFELSLEKNASITQILQNGYDSNSTESYHREKAYSLPSPISPSIGVERPKSKSVVTPKLTNAVDVQRVLESSWLYNHKEVIKAKLLAAQKLKRKRLQDEKAAAIKLERTIPLDILALDWFNENPVTSELRVYLIDRVLPTLVLGMEKILQEAEKFGLLEKDYSYGDLGGTFSPINYLAQYLMRNNPRYSNLNRSSPYARGLRKVSEELRQDILALKENKLALLKADARGKRETVEETEKRKENDAKERARLLKMQFPHWLVDSGKLQLQLVQNALYSYLEISSHLASDAENVIHYSRELDPTDESGKTLTVTEYAEYIEEFVNEMTFPEFVQLLRHMDQCAVAFRRTFEREVWRNMFVKLFSTLDSEDCGHINRQRMLLLLEKFWDKQQDGIKTELHNPRKWPVIELEELDDYFDTDEDSGADESVNVSTEEMGSSEWNSILIPGQSGGVEDSESRPVTLETKRESTGSGRTPDLKESEEDAEKETSPEDSLQTPVMSEDAKTGSSPPEVVDSPSDDQVDKESNKVSSAAGEDEVSDLSKDSLLEKKDTTSTEEVIVTPQKEEEEEVTPQEEAEKESSKDGDAIKSELQVEGKTNAVKEDELSEEEKEFGGEDESREPEKEIKEIGEERGEIEEADPDSKDADPDSKDETHPKSEDQVAEKNNVVEEKKEPAAQVPESNSLLSASGSNLAATLITPAPSTDESKDAGPVNIQFSKEEMQPKVRKTTSISTFQVKKPPLEDRRGTDETLADEGQQELQDSADKKETRSNSMLMTDVEKDSETVATTVVPGSEPVLVQHTQDDMHDYAPQPMEVKTRPASTSRMSVTFAAEPLILPDRPSAEFFSQYTSRSQSRMTSVFDENQLNEGRFISLLENFLSEEANHSVVEELVNFIHGGYVETEEEKMARLEKARREVLSAKHKQMVDNLFNKWDNDGQGYIDNEEVDNVLLKYKGGVEASSLKKAKHNLRAVRKNAPYHDRRRLNRREFHVYINSVVGAMSGGEEVFDGLVEFVTNTVERTYTEKVRGEARRKWLAQIHASAETGGASMEHVYRAVFSTLRKDAEAHGNEKKMSSYIALLEHNLLYPDRGLVLLRYVACTPDNAPFMLGKAFYEDMKGISFYSVRRGKLVHVPRVQSHGRIYFWNPMREDGDREGSLVLVPIRDDRRRTFGLLGVDNVDSAASTDRSIFASHEISFYQGVAKSFSNAFHHVDLRKKLLRIVDAAMSWVHSRAPRVRNIVVYFVEPDPKGQVNSVLRKMVTADNNTGLTMTHNRPQRLYRKDNLFRDYLFKTMENSETTSADAYGERHTAYPLRDEDGRCQCVIDISIGKLKSLPRHENKEVQRMLKLLQAANKEVMKESVGGEKTVVLEAEEKGSDDMRVDIMFDRLMLTDLRENVQTLDSNVFAEVKNYKVPPSMIHNILKAVILLHHRDATVLSKLDDWITCKQMVTGKLRQWIVSYDPTSDRDDERTDEEINDLVQSVGKLLKGIPHGAVAKQGSRPAQQLYNWAFVCLSLIEHARKMKQNEGQPAVTPVTSASTNTTTGSFEAAMDNF